MSKFAFVLAAVVLLNLAGGCASGEIANQACCDDHLVAHDGRPIPGNGDYGEHFGQWGETQWNKFGHTGHTLNWMFLNTNSEDVPYETFWCDQYPRSMTTIGKTVDLHFFNYDWDDPFLGERW
jgi:hypothetical protein